MIKRTLTHFHLCCGLGSGAAGFSDSKPVLGPVQAEWRCLGGVDVDPAGLRDFQMMTGVPGTLRADSWNGPHAYEQCADVVPGLTEALTTPNRKRHRFVCEIQGYGPKPAEHKAPPVFIHQSFRI